jgi:WD40 repeat protein
MSKFYYCTLVACLYTLLTTAQPSAPILRIETGMHGASCKTIATDAAGKYLLTCSDDKTARLWDAATGTLLQTLRIPIGGTDEGKIFACALSPDGKTAAFGGYTGYEWDKSVCIYVVNVGTGDIERRLKGLPDVVVDLEFSPDGQWLAAGLGRNGVFIYRAENWNEYKRLSGYNDAVCNVAFSPGKQLATVCFDGHIRLYDANFSLLRDATTTVGKRPCSIAFNPSGSMMAIGYEDAATVELRAASDLSVIAQPDIANATDPGDLGTISFNYAGDRLYGGGHLQEQNKSWQWKGAIRTWSNAGKGNFTDIPLMRNAVMDIKPLPNGNMAVMGSYPNIAVIDPEGNTVWYRKANINDFAIRDQSHFRISDNGAAIGFTPREGLPTLFDIGSRKLPAEAALYPAPDTANAGTVLSGWCNRHSPAVNGHTCTFLRDYELCNSADISSDGKKVALGASWYLYLCNDRAEKIWETPLPGDAWAVNISGNDRIVAAALGDGTIRWYSMATGKELLAFYLHSDGKRWVLFSPQGYYDASPGAEDFLGWHINHGPDAAPSFYPISRFSRQYHRPDIIDAIFETYDEDAAISLANQRSMKKISEQTDITTKLPPTVTITTPVNGSTVNTTSVTIHYSLSAPADAPVKNVKVLVDGRPVAAERGLKVSNSPSNDYSVQITIPHANCTVTLLAENDNGISPEANLFLSYAAPAADKQEITYKPKLYLLAIGIGKYDNPQYRLTYPAADADQFTAALKKQKEGIYADVIVKELLDTAATKGNIEDGLQWIQEQTGQHDIAMIFYAGHGINDNNGDFYMLPADADINRINRTCLNFEELKKTVSDISGKVVVYIDACHSGNAMGRRGFSDINELVNELSSTQNGAVTITSSTGKEYSLEDPAWQHGAFTLALLEGFAGKGKVPGSNKITVKSLDIYVSERVKELTGGKQHPTSVVPPNIPDFPIGVVP